MKWRHPKVGLVLVTLLACVCAVLWVVSLHAPCSLIWTDSGPHWVSMRSPNRQMALWMSDSVSISLRNHAFFYVSNHTPAVQPDRAPITDWRSIELAGFEYSRGFLNNQRTPHLRLVRLPLSIVTLLLSVWPVYALVAHVRRRLRRRPGYCPKCGYNLTGNISGVCSECGQMIEGDAR